MTLLEFLVALLAGGGLLVKVVDWLILKDQDGTLARAELWKEIGVLRQRLDYMGQKLEAKEIENEKLEDENDALRVRCSQLELRVADLEKQLGMTHIVLPADPHAKGE